MYRRLICIERMPRRWRPLNPGGTNRWWAEATNSRRKPQQNGGDPAVVDPIVQNGSEVFDKERLRVAATDQLNVSKSSFGFAWIDAIETTERHDW
jgi:hypothetical protein